MGHTVLYADWATFGAGAGMRRNKRMLSCALALAPAGRPPVLVHFPGGRGSANMVNLAATAGLRIVRPDGV